MRFPAFLCLFLVSLSSTVVVAQDFPYKKPELSVDTRVADLLSRMTPDEKFWQLFMIPGDLSIGKEKFKDGIFGLEVDARGETTDPAGQILSYGGLTVPGLYAGKINGLQRFFREETRLGIPIIPFAESLHGLGMGGSTSFPQAIALAATWDTSLMHSVALAIAREVRSRGIRQVLDPVINIARDVRWGRVEETYGEDPYLTTVMGNAYISAFERSGVIATPKHFAVNVGDGGRDSYPIHYNNRLLEEIYFPAFRSGFQDAGGRSVMSAYNSLDGSPCTAHDKLINHKLKQEWGFNGFVISDACAVGGANVLHYTAADYCEATVDALNGGLDVIFQTSYDHYPLFKEAFDKGLISSSVIDSAVVRVLRAKFSLGLFDDPFVDEREADKWNGHPLHRELALQAARESLVLLKNDGTLPLKHGMRRIAVIGPDAVEARLGGYSGPGINKISILDGIRQEAGTETVVKYAEGCGRNPFSLPTIPSSYLTTDSAGKTIAGLKGEYFSNIDLSGEPALIRWDHQIHFGWTLYSPDPALPLDWYSVRWTGYISSPVTGKVRLGIEGSDGYRLYLDDRNLIDNWTKRSHSTQIVEIEMVEGERYRLRLEFFESAGPSRIRLVWDAGVEDHSDEKIREAVNIAASADHAIIVAGINEGEFNDRAFLHLPGRQEELILAVAGTGVPVTVVLTGGSAITMNRWMDEVDGIIDAWYPGEVGGVAVVEALFGKYNPAGRLPVTFPVTEGQLPLVYNHKPTGRGDDYTDLTGKPLFPFGYGLSYTSFEYRGMTLDRNPVVAGDTVMVRFRVKNSGSREGDEVCQLYVRDELASVARPVKELKGFVRIHLEAGEEKEIVIPVTPSALTMLDKDLDPVIEPGDFRIMIGASSEDIRLRAILKVL